MAPEYPTIAEAARLIAAKELSPVELLDSRLQRIPVSRESPRGTVVSACQ
ncbi:MAG: hypothetical protein AB7H71_07225 [Alphaproteobacteria bacterium]